MKRIAILGSTGSIGRQTLEVVENEPTIKVVSLTANINDALLSRQAQRFAVEYYATVNQNGENCLIEAVKRNVDLAVFATGGISSLPALIYCLEHDIDVAIANKEVIVCGGELIKAKLTTSKSLFLPIDSEHSAIFQCIGNNKSAVSKILLTASGGSFYDYSQEQLQFVTAQQAEKHPKWQMGADITLDCNTLFNKNLEVIEAKWLFDVDISRIEVIRHKQSIVHSLVEFVDGSVLAQLSQTDMRIPIAYALNYPNRTPNKLRKLNLTQVGSLDFQPVNNEKFPCVGLCRKDNYVTGLMPTVMIGANFACRNLFRQGKIKFTDIYSVISRTLEHFSLQSAKVTVETVKETYTNAIDYTYSLFGE